MKEIIIVASIILTAAVLRFYQLGINPPSLDWDEVSLAYNAYSIIRTGADEYGNAFPLLSIRSFNDYKPPMYTYALIPSLLLFGKSDFAVRFPSALAGTLTVLFTYFLVKELFSKDQKLKTNRLAALSALLLAISPWHLQFSRIAFEANLALCFFVAGIFFLLKSLTKPIFLPISAFTLGLAIFSYHSLRVIIPLLILVILLPKISWLKKNSKFTIIAALTSLVFIAFLLRVISQGAGQARLKTVSFLTIPNLLANQTHRIETSNNSLLSRLVNHRYIAYLNQFTTGYTDHFNLNFWFLEGDGNPRHHAVDFGLLYLIEAPFLILGMIKLTRHRFASSIIYPWFLAAPLASAITSGTPSAVRSLFFLPTFQIFTAVGLGYFLEIRSIRSIRSILFTTVCLLFTTSIITYLDLYYRHTPPETSQAWQYGYKQMVKQGLASKDQYQKVIVTTEYDQPYIFFLWYGGYDPRTWKNDGEFARRFDKFEFRGITWQKDKDQPKALLIGSPKDIPLENRLWTINFLDGTPAFVAART